MPLHNVTIITIPARLERPELILTKIGFEEPLFRALYGYPHGISDTTVPEIVKRCLDQISASKVITPIKDTPQQFEMQCVGGHITFASRPIGNPAAPWTTLKADVSVLICEYFRAVLPPFVHRPVTELLLAARSQNVRLDAIDYRPSKYIDLAIQLGIKLDYKKISDPDFCFTFAPEFGLSAIVMLMNFGALAQTRSRLEDTLKNLKGEGHHLLRSVGLKSVPYPYNNLKGMRLRIQPPQQATLEAIDQVTDFLDAVNDFKYDYDTPTAAEEVISSKIPSLRVSEPDVSAVSHATAPPKPESSVPLPKRSPMLSPPSLVFPAKPPSTVVAFDRDLDDLLG